VAKLAVVIPAYRAAVVVRAALLPLKVADALPVSVAPLRMKSAPPLP
jgi:hypothetical protein